MLLVDLVTRRVLLVDLVRRRPLDLDLVFFLKGGVELTFVRVNGKT